MKKHKEKKLFLIEKSIKRFQTPKKKYQLKSKLEQTSLLEHRKNRSRSRKKLSSGKKKTKKKTQGYFSYSRLFCYANYTFQKIIFEYSIFSNFENYDIIKKE